MKLKVIVIPQPQVLDPQGQTVKKALHHMGHTNVRGTTVGRYLEFELEPGIDAEAAKESLKRIAVRANIFNPVMEDCRIEIGE